MKKYIVGIVKIKPDRVEEALEAIKICAERVAAAEPETRREMRQSDSDPTTFFKGLF